MLLDGRDIREIPVRALRRTIGVVPQEPTLFSDTLARNIAFGAPDADMKEIEFAAQVAGLAPDVAMLPRGYDTIVGERGMSLSGGQKQRVTIARLLTYHPSVVVLDDALSSVDTETERAVLHNLSDSVQGRTTIVVAHRASTVRDADEIIVLEEGHIAERGTHEELMGAPRNLRGAFSSPVARRRVGAILMVHEEQQAREVRIYDTHLIRWIWQFVKPYQRLFWISVVLMPLNSVFALAQPYIVKLTIDIFLAHRKGRAASMAGDASSRAWRRTRTVRDGRAVSDAGARRVRNLLRPVLPDDDGRAVQPLRFAPGLVPPVEQLPMAFFDRTPIGRLVSRISTDIDAISDMFASGSLTILSTFCTLAGIARHHVHAESAARAVGVSARFRRCS